MWHADAADSVCVFAATTARSDGWARMGGVGGQRTGNMAKVREARLSELVLSC